MRALQLLAIVTVCPLAGIASSCARIEQPIGEYQAAAERPSQPPREPSMPSGGAPADSAARNAAQPNIDIASSDPMAMAKPNPSQTTGLRPTATTATDPMPGATEEACNAAWSVAAKRKRLEMYIVMDANITLPYTGLWEYMTAGLQAFVRDDATQGTGVGLRYFGSQCDPDPYNSQPTVEVGVLPDNEGQLIRALQARVNFSSSPMAPALQGGIYHQIARSQKNPDTKQIVVLATDGITQDLTLTCRDTPTDVQNIAATGFNGSPQIETWVVGFGIPDTMNSIADDVLARFSPLESIAAAGGTRRAIMIKNGADPTPVHDALTSIRRMAQPCDYAVPENADPANLNLTFDPSGRVPRVDDSAKCGQSAGFFYLPDDKAPTTIRLCPASCTPLHNADFQAVLLGGCPTVRR